MNKKVLKSDLKELNFTRGLMSVSRRFKPVEQLKCVGDELQCKAFQPKIVKCKLIKKDNCKSRWDCPTHNKHFRFNKTDIYCEGYKDNKDEYILDGSCVFQVE